MADAGVCRWRGCSVCAASSTRRWARAAAAFRNTTRPRCRPSSTGCTRPPATSSSSKRISTWRPTSSSTSVPCLAGFFSLLFLFTFQTAFCLMGLMGFFLFAISISLLGRVIPSHCPSLTGLGFYRVLPGFTEFYLVLLGFTGFYRD